nr:threonine--tRNA ligase, chloroplastic/mitochondrial 2 [Ipomoea batatas]
MVSELVLPEFQMASPHNQEPLSMEARVCKLEAQVVDLGAQFQAIEDLVDKLRVKVSNLRDEMFNFRNEILEALGFDSSAPPLMNPVQRGSTVQTPPQPYQFSPPLVQLEVGRSDRSAPLVSAEESGYPAGDPEAVMMNPGVECAPMAVQKIYPNAKVTIGPCIENEFYYDFDREHLTDKDLKRIKPQMITTVQSNSNFPFPSLQWGKTEFVVGLSMNKVGNPNLPKLLDDDVILEKSPMQDLEAHKDADLNSGDIKMDGIVTDGGRIMKISHTFNVSVELFLKQEDWVTLIEYFPIELSPLGNYGYIEGVDMNINFHLGGIKVEFPLKAQNNLSGQCDAEHGFYDIVCMTPERVCLLPTNFESILLRLRICGSVMKLVGKTPNDYVNHDEVFALEAVVQDGVLVGNESDIVFLYVTLLSIALKIRGGSNVDGAGINIDFAVLIRIVLTTMRLVLQVEVELDVFYSNLRMQGCSGIPFDPGRILQCMSRPKSTADDNFGRHLQMKYGLIELTSLVRIEFYSLRYYPLILDAYNDTLGLAGEQCRENFGSFERDLVQTCNYDLQDPWGQGSVRGDGTVTPQGFQTGIEGKKKPTTGSDPGPTRSDPEPTGSDPRTTPLY